jgi:glucan phosphoethanolaminetransferase (alkaline phosphatase superfamily)
MEDFFSKLSNIGKANILGKVYVKGVMASHLWLVAIFVLSLTVLSITNANSLIILGFFILILIIVLFYAYTYRHFMDNNPKFLMSEEKIVEVIKIENMGVKGNLVPANVIEGEASTENPKAPEIKKINSGRKDKE